MTRGDLPNFRDFCEAACVKLWGDPSSRNARELRWDGADAYSAKSFNRQKKAWYDHGERRGGSTLDLVAYEKGQPKPDLRGAAFFDTWAEAYRMGIVPDEPPAKVNGKGNGQGGPALAIRATYPYHDEGGQLLFEVVRFDTADLNLRFRQRRPDGAGGWIWDTKGVRTHVLYRLPALIEALKAGQRVLVCEGERDADTAVALGFPATTMPGGAGKWRSEYNHYFQGADVVIVSDNDPQATDPKTGAPRVHPNGAPVLPGQEHAATVVKHLRKVAAHVRLILPGKHKDLTAWREAGGTKAALEAMIAAAPDLTKQPAPAEPPDHSAGFEDEKAQAAARPTITLGPSETERAVNVVERLLIASGRGLYQRGGLIVSTGFTIAKTWDAQDARIQIIEERGDCALGEDMEAVADFSAPDKYGVFRPVNPPKRIVYTLKDRKSRLRFPILTAIVNCPSISADGKLLEDPGYDPATGILFDPLGVTFPRVPQLLNKRIAAEALARIKRPFETFPFVDDDSRAVALSGALTAVARRGLPFTPIHGFDAPVAGAGKGKLVDIFCIIATGRRAGVMAQGKTDEEFDKALGAVLIRGDPMIAIDNCSRPVESDLLNMTQTQEFVEVRLLGHSIMIRVQSKAFTTITGNNLAIVGDLIRRTLICRLDPKTERPELLQFDFDPIAHTIENRAQLVVDVLTVLKAYHNAGRPGRPPRLQSFEHWSDTVRGALIWLGEGDPVKTMERMRSADATLAAMGAVFSAWRDHFHFASVSAADVIARAEEYDYVAAPVASGGGLFPPQVRQCRHPDLRDALIQVAQNRNGKLDPVRLGYWLRKVRDRVVALPSSERIALVDAGAVHGGVVAWKLEIR